MREHGSAAGLLRRPIAGCGADHTPRTPRGGRARSGPGAPRPAEALGGPGGAAALLSALALLLAAAAALAYDPKPSTSKGPQTVTLGALVPASDLDWGQRLAATFLYAVDRVNNRTDLLPTIRIVPRVFDTGMDNAQGMGAALDLVEEHAIAAVGPATSRVALPAATLLRTFQTPQVSMSATDPELTNKPAYDFFTRVAPSDTLQASALASLLVALGFRSCGVLSADEAYGQNLARGFAAAARAAGIRVLLWQSFRPEESDVAPQLLNLKAAGARLIVLFQPERHEPIFLSAERAGMIGPEWMYVGGDSFTTGFPLDAVANLTQGSLGLQPDAQMEQAPAQEYIRAWSRQDPAVYYTAGGTQEIDTYMLFTADAVLCIATALDSLVRAGVQLNSSFGPAGVHARNPYGAALRDAITGQHISGVTGPIKMDASGDRVTTFTVVNYVGTRWRQVGRFDFDTGFSPLPGTSIVWPGPERPYDGSCSEGTAPDSSGACVACPAGSYAQQNFIDCKPCPPSSYAAAAGSDRCLPCAPGTFAPAWGSAVCRPCDAGTFAALANATSCLPCPLGRWENRFGSVLCSPADVNEFVPALFSTKPTECPAHALTNKLASTNISDCVCTPGFYSVKTMDGARYRQCYPCPANGGRCGGGPAYAVAEGYWRIPWDYHTVVECGNNGCAGGPDSECREGYLGNWCTTCDVGYGIRTAQDCKLCSSMAASLTGVVCGVGSLVIAAGIISYFSIKSAFGHAGTATIVTRVIVDHMALNSYVQSIPMRWPEIVHKLLAFNTLFNNPIETFVTIDCVMAGAQYRRERVYFWKATGYLGLILCCFILPVLALSVVAWSQVYRAQKRKFALRRESRSAQLAAPVHPHPQAVHPLNLAAVAAAAKAKARAEAAAAASDKEASPANGDGPTHRAGHRTFREAGALALTARKVSHFIWPESGSLGPAVLQDPAKPPFHATWSDYYVVIAMASLFLVQPSVAERSLDLFRCKSLGGGGPGDVAPRSFVRGSMNIDCYSPEHVQWLVGVSLPGTLLIVVLVPALWIRILWRGRGEGREEPQYVLRYSWLYDGYRDGVYWWEIVQVYRKLFLVTINVFMAEQPQALGLISLAFFILNACVDLFVLPFKDRLINALNFFSLGVNLFTVYCGLGFISNTMNNEAMLATTVAVSVANVSFFVFAGVVLFRAVFLLVFKTLVPKIPFLRKRLRKQSVYKLLRYTSQAQGHISSVLSQVQHSNRSGADAGRAPPEKPADGDAAPRRGGLAKKTASKGSRARVALPGDEGYEEAGPSWSVDVPAPDPASGPAPAGAANRVGSWTSTEAGEGDVYGSSSSAGSAIVRALAPSDPEAVTSIWAAPLATTEAQALNHEPVGAVEPEAEAEAEAEAVVSEAPDAKPAPTARSDAGEWAPDLATRVFALHESLPLEAAPDPEAPPAPAPAPPPLAPAHRHSLDAVIPREDA